MDTELRTVCSPRAQSRLPSVGLYFPILLLPSPQASTMRNMSRMGTKIIYAYLSPTAQCRREKSEQRRGWLPHEVGLSLLVLAGLVDKGKSETDRRARSVFETLLGQALEN